ncbi:GatB/YqeY domain-containing protein [Gloeothece verrucosa]|uniref:GatB/YqeY domain protein n=1 Tax=Gloeothece verrucosa (strain PCC 7822) TaxID=497965 RepID=E0U5Z0_GLOV7|nr:GatB/YqeY domain-containing protein [Gloeothece verrucosa]ADN17099.1 hypothetical protein Cyan7822_5218 [Gloeothece verrucosa PCC 7822]
MTQLYPSSLNQSKFLKVLKKSLKKVVSLNGINSATKNGNKELEVFLAKIRENTFTSTAQAEKIGNSIGSRIVELSQQKGKKNLDQGVIRLLSEEKFISPQLFESPIDASAVPPIKPPTAAETFEVQQQEPSPAAESEASVTHEDTSVIEQEAATADTSAAVGSESQTPVGLKERLGEDIKTAMKAKDKIRLETVRSIKKALLEKEVALRPSGQETLTPEQEIELLAQQAKQRRDSIEQFKKGGREDLAEKEALELAIIETYLPAQLSEEKLKEIIDQIITEVGATSAKDMGRVMGVAVKQLKGQADGKQIQAIVKEKLT